MKTLQGKVALVAGATRGAGRGIATRLGEAGATVYCTGRSSRETGPAGSRPETIEETAEQVTALGGRGIAVRVDHSREDEIAALVARIRKDSGGLDVLVNDIWGGDELLQFEAPFWKLPFENGRLMFERGLFTHLMTSRHVVPLLVEQNRGLIVEVTDGDAFGYRGSFYYDLVKMSVIRAAFTMSVELRKTAITALAVTPGFLRSEAMLQNFGVTEANWRDGTKVDPNFIASETPVYVGRAVAALAGDPQVAKKAGRVWSSWALAREYGFTDADGSKPDWGSHFAKTYGRPYRVADEAAYASWREGFAEIAFPEWPKF